MSEAKKTSGFSGSFKRRNSASKLQGQLGYEAADAAAVSATTMKHGGGGGGTDQTKTLEKAGVAKAESTQGPQGPSKNGCCVLQ